MKVIPIIWDFDLTISKRYQQVPLFSERFAAIKKYLKKRGFLFEREEDYFEWSDALGGDQGIAYMQRMVMDAQKGGPLEGLSNKELFEMGKLIEPATGFRDMLLELKKEFEGKAIIKHFFISVGLRPMIDGFIHKQRIKTYVEKIAASEFHETKGVISGIKKVVSPYAKTEYIIAFMKGGHALLNKKMRPEQYLYSYKKALVIGDGFTDTAKFAFGKKKGATPIVVYKPGNDVAYRKAQKTVGTWVDFILPRDYTPNGTTYKYMKEIIESKLAHKYPFPPIILYDYRKGKLTHKGIVDQILKEKNNPAVIDYFTHIRVDPKGRTHKTIHF